MTVESGYKRYQFAISKLGHKHVMPAYEARKNGVAFTMPQDAAFQVVFTGLTEISSSVDTLLLIETLLALSPPRSRRIQEEDYLKFLVGAYLQEVYILKQRLNAYATKISRLYTRHLGKVPIILSLDSIVASIDLTLQGVTDARGKHVHAQRFSDDDLDMVAALSLMNRHNPSNEINIRLHYSMVSSKWHKTVKKNNGETIKLLDIYFDWLYPVVSKDGEVYLPEAGRQSRKTR